VRPQPVQPVGQSAGEPPTAAADDGHVEELLLLGQEGQRPRPARPAGEAVRWLERPGTEGFLLGRDPGRLVRPVKQFDLEPGEKGGLFRGLRV
jgi:hypothetical protein